MDFIPEYSLMVSSGVHAGKFCNEELFSYIRREFPATLMTAFVYDETQIETAIRPDYMYISTNAAYGPHHDNVGHPEGAGTFPKFLSQYVRDKKVLPLITAIKKCTLLPAERIGISKKGALEVGNDADITVFDLKKIASNSNYVGFGNPNAEPEGIDYVIVAGHVVKDIGGVVESKTFYGKMIKA